MSDPFSPSDGRLLAELNDLLQLDHDAVQAYAVAIESLTGEQLRTTVGLFRGDHERHITDLTQVIRMLGGTPSELPHIPTGFFKLALQKAAAAGSDRELLLAFKANEGQVRDKYRRAAAAVQPGDVSTVIRRNAADEERHYAWVTQALEAMGAGATSTIGRVEAGVETVHGRTADAIEAGERELMYAAEKARETAGELGDRARDAAADVGDRARELAANAGDRALEVAGTGLEGAARGLDRAAEWADDRGGFVARAAPPARRFADVLEHEGTHLRQQDIAAVRRDVEDGVRSHPIRAVLIAAGIGYVVGRMLR